MTPNTDPQVKQTPRFAYQDLDILDTLFLEEYETLAINEKKLFLSDNETVLVSDCFVLLFIPRSAWRVGIYFPGSLEFKSSYRNALRYSGSEWHRLNKIQLSPIDYPDPGSKLFNYLESIPLKYRSNLAQATVNYWQRLRNKRAIRTQLKLCLQQILNE